MARACSELGDSSDDEFPDLNSLVGRNKAKTGLAGAAVRLEKEARAAPAPKSPGKTPLRRRKLVKLEDSALLRPWAKDERISSDNGGSRLPGDTERINRPGVQLRARKQKPAAEAQPDELTEADIPPVEEISVGVSVDDSSEFYDTARFDSNDDDDDDDDTFDNIFPKSLANQNTHTRRAKASPAKARLPQPTSRVTSATECRASRHGLESFESEELNVDTRRTARKRSEKTGKGQGHAMENKCQDGGIPREMANLPIDNDDLLLPPVGDKKGATTDRPTTPPSTPPKPRATGLVSPVKKLARIPMTPHRPSMDMFWSREFVDDWNDEHSPRKQLFPDAAKSPSKASPSKKKTKNPAKPAVSAREAKKAFEKTKHELAAKFLHELDATITQGQLGELAASTGGIQVTWTNKLNTTAGRANWKRETVRTRTSSADGGAEVVTVSHRHRASIELAEKVIDDEHRLLNVVAHEFCHLANFMVNGVTGNPHGKEFKAWAAKCSRAFAGRGIEVTTKHSYDIDFKYVWACVICAAEFKRHSKSINPERHRCGSCKGELRQTKPVPRGQGRESEYQKFMKEHMKLLREENPKSPQKDIMKLVADKWSRQEKKGDSKKAGKGVDIVDDVADGLDALSLGEGK